MNQEDPKIQNRENFDARSRLIFKIFDHYLFPQMHSVFGRVIIEGDRKRPSATLKEKAWFLGYIINRYLRVILKRDKPSDRDHMARKRASSSGQLLAQKFKQLVCPLTRLDSFVPFFKNLQFFQVQKVQKDMCIQLKNTAIKNKKDPNPRNALKPNIITRGFSSAIKTGTWTGPSSKQQAGVAQVKSTHNYVSFLSHARRTMASDSNNKLPRQLNNTHWFKVCSHETPEGQPVSATTTVSNNSFLRALTQIYYSVD